MKKLLNSIKLSFVSLVVTPVFLKKGVLAADPDAAPLHIREAESWVVNGLIAIWSLSILYFIFLVISIGAQWMIAMGDEQKLASLKKRGGNIVLAFFLVFGGYIVVRLLISLLVLQDPNSCFTSPFGDVATFQFFFPGVCE